MATGSENVDGTGAGVEGVGMVAVTGTTEFAFAGEAGFSEAEGVGVATDFGAPLPLPLRPGFGVALGVAAGVEESASLSPAAGVDLGFEWSPEALGAALCRKS